MSAAAWRWVWQQAASPSDIWRLTRMAGTSSGPPSAAWRRPTSSTSRGQASAPGFINRTPSSPSNARQLLQFLGTSSRSLSEPAAWKGRIYAPSSPASRLFLPGLGQDRQHSTANLRQRQTTKPHLYLVLDDHGKQYTIHKLDIDNDDPDVGCGSAETPGCLPDPPVIRIGPPTIGKFARFAALGSHIIGVGPFLDGDPLIDASTCGGTVIFDTKTAMLCVSNVLPGEILFGHEAAIAVRNRLYVFESRSDHEGDTNGNYNFPGGLHCLAADPNDDESHWAWPWRSLHYSSCFSWSWTACPPFFPFNPKSISAYVVHPRTGTIFLSAWGGMDCCGTYSYGSTGRGQWKRRADWVLPFKGPAHYDKALGAWVGLHRHVSERKDADDGYLCACRVIAPGQPQPPKWNVSGEKLFLEHPHWTHVDAKLVYMGEGSKYCLVERLVPVGADKMNYVIRLATFVVMYGEDGELRTMAHRPARFYKAPSYRCKFDVQAFWI